MRQAASEKSQQGEERRQRKATKAAEEVLKPTDGVKLPPPTAKPGDKCEKGTAGCEDGEFTGNFFGE